MKTFYELNKLFEQNIDLWSSPPADYLSSLEGILDSLRAIKRYDEMPFFIEKTGLSNSCFLIVNACVKFVRGKAKTLFISSGSDQFYLPHQIESTVKAIPGARSVVIDSPAGHLICCNGDPNATYAIGEAFKSFLKELRK